MRTTPGARNCAKLYTGSNTCSNLTLAVRRGRGAFTYPAAQKEAGTIHTDRALGRVRETLTLVPISGTQDSREHSTAPFQKRLCMRTSIDVDSHVHAEQRR